LSPTRRLPLFPANIPAKLRYTPGKKRNEFGAYSKTLQQQQQQDTQSCTQPVVLKAERTARALLFIREDYTGKTNLGHNS